MARKGQLNPVCKGQTNTAAAPGDLTYVEGRQTHRDKESRTDLQGTSHLSPRSLYITPGQGAANQREGQNQGLKGKAAASSNTLPVPTGLGPQVNRTSTFFAGAELEPVRCRSRKKDHNHEAHTLFTQRRTQRTGEGEGLT